MKPWWHDLPKIFVTAGVCGAVLFMVLYVLRIPDNARARFAIEHEQSQRACKFMVELRPQPDPPETRLAHARATEALCTHFGVGPTNVPRTEVTAPDRGP